MPQHVKGQRTVLWSRFSLHLHMCPGMQLRLPGLHGTILPYRPTSNLSGCLPGVLIALFGFVYLDRNVVALFHLLVML